MQEIVISGSLEMGLNEHPAPEKVTLAESREAFPAPAVIQVVHPLEQVAGQSDKAKYTRARSRRPLLPDRMLLNLYLPPRGLALPIEDVSIPGRKAPKRLSIGGGPSIGVNLRLTICTSCTQ